MTASLKPTHLGRYRDIAMLLVKHRRSIGDGASEAGEVAPSEDAREDAAQLANDLESMGPTFVKLGQLLSTRSDLLPPVYLDALARLQDDVEPIPFSEVEAVVTQEIGTRISQAFSFFDHEPLASASLGQVHRAALRDGRPVAVKVQRPGVRERVVEDMAVIEELAAFADEHTSAGRRFGLGDMVEEFRRALMLELDYTREAANLTTLADDLADHPAIVVPRPIPDYTTPLVLTMELVEGRSVSSISGITRTEIDGAALADALFRAYLEQILVNGFVHADPHPGNVFLTSDQRLALIDLGMVTRVSGTMQDQLIRLLIAVSDGRGDEAADVLARIADVQDGADVRSFERRIVDLVEQQQGLTAGELEAGRIVGELAAIAGECGLRPPSELTMVSKALLNLDQVAALLDPDFDPNVALRDHVADIMRRNVLKSASPANVLSAALDAKEFAEKLPGRVNKVMDALAEGQLTLNVQGIDEAELMRGIQKLANRVTTGIVVAALIVGAAMVMRIETGAQLFGYPAVAIVLFLLASVAGLWLVGTSLLHDLPQSRSRRDERDQRTR